MSPKAQSLTFKWLAGILVTVLVMICAGWVRDISARTAANEMGGAERNERLARIEAQIAEANNRLARIEVKLDQRARP